MRIGTKSLLIGAHQVLVHPVAVAVAFRRLYGRWPSWREAVCIAIHDWGYWWCCDMNGPEGRRHPEWAARVAGVLFGEAWHDWCLYHSRHVARRDGRVPSRLCWADKMGTALTPWWLYLPGARLSGELDEYRYEAHWYNRRTGKGIDLDRSDREWFGWVTGYMADQAQRGCEDSRMEVHHEDY